MSEWIKAEDVPTWMEGMRAWIYRPGDLGGIDIGWVPTGFSRDPRHCGGIQVWVLQTPFPPSDSAMRSTRENADGPQDRPQ